MIVMILAVRNRQPRKRHSQYATPGRRELAFLVLWLTFAL
jgi:hypothetical protein